MYCLLIFYNKSKAEMMRRGLITCTSENKREFIILMSILSHKPEDLT